MNEQLEQLKKDFKGYNINSLMDEITVGHPVNIYGNEYHPVESNTGQIAYFVEPKEAYKYRLLVINEILNC